MTRTVTPFLRTFFCTGVDVDGAAVAVLASPPLVPPEIVEDERVLVGVVVPVLEPLEFGLELVWLPPELLPPEPLLLLLLLLPLPLLLGLLV